MSSSRHALNLDPTRAAHLPLCPWLPLPGCEAALAHSLSEEASFDSPCSCAALRCPSPGFDARRSRPLSTALRLHCQLWASVRYRGGNKVEAAGGFPARNQLGIQVALQTRRGRKKKLTISAADCDAWGPRRSLSEPQRGLCGQARRSRRVRLASAPGGSGSAPGGVREARVELAWDLGYGCNLGQHSAMGRLELAKLAKLAEPLSPAGARRRREVVTSTLVSLAVTISFSTSHHPVFHPQGKWCIDDSCRTHRHRNRSSGISHAPTSTPLQHRPHRPKTT
ncbi:hypothetical protein L1887_44545 [Cichorium endivia]|nr:hypothetical protein L1887_44545 [Cichorium endivia]